jgi:NAD-dependent deacetylase
MTQPRRRGEAVRIPQTLVEALGRARKLAVLTGAGISAESGVPTFRDAQTGLWARYDPQDLATPEAFRRDPKLVWEWYAWRRTLVAAARPNPGHFALVRMQERQPGLVLITQNVDGLHARAGSRDVVELHGNIARIVCSAGCGAVDDFDPDAAPPRCPKCAAWLRPDVVWFGEPLPAAALESARHAAADCEIFFSVGTSALVYPAADLPRVARDAGALLVEINPDDTALSALADFALRGPAGALLPALLEATERAGKA